MTKLMEAELMEHSLRLINMGAEVNVINSKMCFAVFHVSGHEISYCYNINKKGRYFLQRLKPYPLALKEFDAENDVIDIIEIDLEQFLGASGSRHMDDFIDIGKRLYHAAKAFEDLFLYYNVPGERTAAVREKLESIEAIIQETVRTADRLFYKKDPDNL